MTLIDRALSSTLFKESFLYGLTGVISRFAPFLIIPIYIGYIGIDGFGYLDLYVTIGSALFIFFEMQVVSGVMRSYYECKKENCLQELIGSAVKIYLLSYITGLSALTLLWFFDPVFFSIKYILPIALVIFPRKIFSLYNIVLRMEHRAKEFVYINIINVFFIATCGLLSLLIFNVGFVSILYGFFIGELVVSVFAWHRLNKFFYLRLSSKYVKEILIYSAPIVISVLGGWFLASSGRIVLAEEATAFELGSFSLSLKVSMIYMIFILAFKTAWDPYCMNKLERNNSKMIFAVALNYYWVFGVFGVACIYMVAPFLMSFLGASEDAINDDLVLLLLLGFFWQGGINLVATGNIWVRKTYLNSIGTIFGGITSLIITYATVNKLGVIGAGVGYSLGMLLSYIIIFSLAQKNINIAYNYIYIALMISASLVIIVNISF